MCSRAHCSQTWIISGKTVLVISETIIPKCLVRPEISARAWGLGKYPRSSTILHTRLASCGCTLGCRLIVRDTVAVETLARLAISRIFIFSPRNASDAWGRSSLYRIRRIEKLPDRWRRRMARHCPKNRNRHFFLRVSPFSWKETPSVNDIRSKKASLHFSALERPVLDQPSASADHLRALRHHSRHLHQTHCLCLPQNHVR